MRVESMLDMVRRSPSGAPLTEGAKRYGQRYPDQPPAERKPMEQPIWIGVVRIGDDGIESHLMEVQLHADIPNDAQFAVKFKARDFAAALERFRAAWGEHVERMKPEAK